MSVSKNNDCSKEREAQKRLEFYGFWLWNYQYADHIYEYHEPSFEEIEAEIKAKIYRQLRCDLCDQRREYCKYCSIYRDERLYLLINSIFEPWNTEVVCQEGMSDIVRYSSEKILSDAYLLKRNSAHKVAMHKAYLLRDISDGFTILEVREGEYSDAKDWITVPRKMIVTVELDLSVPLKSLLASISTLHGAAWDSRLNHADDFDEANLAYISKSGFYQEKLHLLLSFDNISFNPSAHPARALGFWLWEQTDRLNSFTSVAQAIQYLESGREFPQDILQQLGFQNSDMTVFNRLKRQTARCIEAKEVLSIG